MFSEKKLLLIDLDDTLWDTRYNNKEGLRELYTALDWGQYFVSFEDYFSVYIVHNEYLWEEYNHSRVTKEYLSIDRLRHPLREMMELEDSQWLEIDKQYKELVKQQTRLCPGALETMAYLNARYKTCILSNGFGELQFDKLERSGLAAFCDGVVLSEDVGVQKPDRRIFDHALEKMSYSADESLVIGDRYGTDIVGASGAGLESIWYNPDGLEQPSKEIVSGLLTTVSDLRELQRIL